MRASTAVLVSFATLITIAPAPAAADFLFETGFERPSFVPGLLAGQDGIIAANPSLNTDVASIVTEFPASGVQSVRFAGDLIQKSPTSDFWAARYRPNFVYDAIGSGTPRVTLQADLALIGPATSTDLVSVNLAARDTAGRRFSEIWLSSDGTAWTVGAGADMRTVPYLLNRFNTVTLALDFTSLTTEFFLNGTSLGTRGFGTGKGGMLIPTFSMEAVIAPTAYRAYVDDLRMSAVPEPAGLTLLVLGVLGTCGYGLCGWAGSPGKAEDLP
jgi:hypothetical protein